ncbi:Cullin-4 [Gossypium arboreum]|uniref:Cullin-4 n=1 Tax=Gossypium arboreum TaxID=29729 RepID=A0A0B0NLG9_GOSAR|nr:Cullin-4 [Gossypium arboreum]
MQCKEEGPAARIPGLPKRADTRVIVLGNGTNTFFAKVFPQAAESPSDLVSSSTRNHSRLLLDRATAIRKKFARESRDCSTGVFQKPLVLSAAEIPLLGFFQVWAFLQIGLIGLWAFVYVWAIC